MCIIDFFVYPYDIILEYIIYKNNMKYNQKLSFAYISLFFC